MHSTGFVHFFRPKIQDLFKDFPGPYFEISIFSKNLPQTKQHTCVSNERALGIKTSVFTHFYEHFEDVILRLPVFVFTGFHLP